MTFLDSSMALSAAPASDAPSNLAPVSEPATCPPDSVAAASEACVRSAPASTSPIGEQCFRHASCGSGLRPPPLERATLSKGAV